MPSLLTTAFALSAYVKMKKNGTEEIANWLCQNRFADYSESANGEPERHVELTKSFEYICPMENITGHNNFTINV